MLTRANEDMLSAEPFRNVINIEPLLFCSFANKKFGLSSKSREKQIYLLTTKILILIKIMKLL